jgi:septal ring factor EnvC (AmiA/AmiB activator)
MIYEKETARQCWVKAALQLLMMAVALGCDNEDKRLVELAREADARQADQNREIAQQNHDLADATNKLIQADAEAHKELMALERDVQAERAEVGHQRDELEDERREIAHERRFDSTAGDAVRGGTVLLACLLPLLLCGYMLHLLDRY